MPSTTGGAGDASRSGGRRRGPTGRRTAWGWRRRQRSGLPTMAPAPNGRESQSMALLRTAGMVPLYSGVTTRTRSAAATGARSADGARGRVVAVDVLVVERDLPRPSTMSTVTPSGAWSRRSSAMLAVEGVGAEAADEDGDAGGLGVVMAVETDRGPVPFPMARREFLRAPTLSRRAHPSLPLLDAPAARAARRGPQPRGPARRRPLRLVERRRRRLRDHGRRRCRGRGRQGHGLPAVRQPRGADGGAAQPLRDRVAGGGDVRPAAARARARRRWSGCWRSAVADAHQPAARRADRGGRPGGRPVAWRRSRSRRCTCATCSASSGSTATCPARDRDPGARSRSSSWSSRSTGSGIPVDRLDAGWADLVRRVVGDLTSRSQRAGGAGRR